MTARVTSNRPAGGYTGKRKLDAEKTKKKVLGFYTTDSNEANDVLSSIVKEGKPYYGMLDLSKMFPAVAQPDYDTVNKLYRFYLDKSEELSKAVDKAVLYAADLTQQRNKLEKENSELKKVIIKFKKKKVIK